MKKQAIKDYKITKKQKRMNWIGYYNAKVVKVTKNGHKYRGIAMAVKNTKGIRCEVRGVSGAKGYLTNKGIIIV